MLFSVVSVFLLIRDLPFSGKMISNVNGIALHTEIERENILQISKFKCILKGVLELEIE